MVVCVSGSLCAGGGRAVGIARGRAGAHTHTRTPRPITALASHTQTRVPAAKNIVFLPKTCTFCARLG